MLLLAASQPPIWPTGLPWPAAQHSMLSSRLAPQLLEHACMHGAQLGSNTRLLCRLRIDDPLDASPIHLFCGMWGLFSTGLFATEVSGGSIFFRGWVWRSLWKPSAACGGPG